MQQYWVEIIETLSTIVSCDARNEQEAIQMVQQLYRSQKIVLGAENLVSVDYQVVEKNFDTPNEKPSHYA